MHPAMSQFGTAFLEGMMACNCRVLGLGFTLSAGAGRFAHRSDLTGSSRTAAADEAALCTTLGAHPDISMSAPCSAYSWAQPSPQGQQQCHCPQSNELPWPAADLQAQLRLSGAR